MTHSILSRPLAALAAGILLCATAHAATNAPNATPTPIPKGPVYVQLAEVASSLTAPGSLLSPNDSSGRLFIVQQSGAIMILKNGAIQPTPFLNVASRMVALNPGYDERGLLGFAFHPDFNNSAAAGYRKVYTYTSEPNSGPADFTVPKSSGFSHQNVVAEWQVSANNPDVVDPATRREVMRIDHPQGNHDAGDLHFRPADRYLYIATGDGGGGNDTADGHTPNLGNGQDLSNILGKVLRIDPLAPSLTPNSADPISANGKYRVPISNPFAGDAGSPITRDEIYNYGLRNPYRFSFDAVADRFVLTDVGQGNIEEINIGAPGLNYGWNRKEGTKLFNPATGSVSDDPNPNPAFTNPIAEYSHTDGTAIIGGFIYRGALLPALAGKYVFGEFSRNNNGRLFYTDLADGAIRELRLGATDAALGAFLKGVGRDNRGELYALVDVNSGPSGTGGRALKITTIPPASAFSRKIHGGTGFDLNVLTTNPIVECRSGGPGGDYQIVFGFNAPVTFTGATATPGNGGTGTAGSTSTGPGGTEVTVNVTGVSNAQLLTVTLLGVTEGSITRDVSVQMWILIGDTNGDGVVNAGDAQQTRNRSGQPLDFGTFRSDVTVDGSINAGDAIAVRSRSGSSIPQ